MTNEQRPVDLAQEAQGIAAEAAELAEHIRDTDPRWRREALLDQLVEMIDDAHEAAATAQVRLEDADPEVTYDPPEWYWKLLSGAYSARSTSDGFPDVRDFANMGAVELEPPDLPVTFGGPGWEP